MVESAPQNEEKENLVGSAFLDFFYIVAKSRKFLFIFIFVISSAAILLAVLTPKEYKASASVLPAGESDLLSSLSGISALAKSFAPLQGLSSLSGGSEIDRYIAILNSKSVQHRVIDKFNLRKVYDLEDDESWKVEEALSDNVDFSLEDEGNLLVSVYDQNPVRSAKMANYMVELLNEINTQLHVTNAKATREFIEKRYFQNLEDIEDFEIQMKEFQEKYGVIAVPEQIEATVKSTAELYVDLAREEIALNVLRKTLNEENPLLKNKEIEIKQIKAYINQLSIGAAITKNPKVLIPLNVAPELVNKYLNIHKNLEIQYTIAQFLTPVYEQAKIEEIRNTPSVLVLDEAYPPERKARPKISLYGLIGFVVSLVLGLFIVFTLESFRKMEQINPQKFSYIYNSFRPFSKLILRSSSVGKSK
ncbi:MAG: Wzz/FepE/Etk N-terminal domain-containing protein [Ignavibacteriaceae bacterium]